MTKKERQAKEYFNELAEGAGTMIEPGQSVNTQSPCINCGIGYWVKEGTGFKCLTTGCPHKKDDMQLEIAGKKTVKVLDVVGDRNFNIKDWKYHTVKLRGIELDSLPLGHTIDDQIDKIYAELKELSNAHAFHYDKDRVSDEAFDVITGCMTLIKMLRIDIEEANRKHCAKLEARGWRARD